MTLKVCGEKQCSDIELRVDYDRRYLPRIATTYIEAEVEREK